MMSGGHFNLGRRSGGFRLFFGAIVVGLLVVCSAPGGAVAALITFQNNTVYSGTGPVGTPPWLTTTFNDGGGTGSVTMTLTATNLTDNEFVSEYYLNLDPLMDPTSLSFSAPSKVGSFNDPAVNLGADSFKADGDGYFDIQLGFATNDGLPTRFTAGDAVTYTITGPSLTASSFSYLSVKGNGGYFDAAHIQGVGAGSLSGWDTSTFTFGVPEPATLALLALGGLGVIGRAVRRFRPAA